MTKDKVITKLKEDIENAIANTAGSPSGIAPIARVTAVMNISNQGKFLS